MAYWIYRLALPTLLAMALVPGLVMALEPYDATYTIKRGKLTVGETRYQLQIILGGVSAVDR